VSALGRKLTYSRLPDNFQFVLFSLKNLKAHPNYQKCAMNPRDDSCKLSKKISIGEADAFDLLLAFMFANYF
jgi:hypothetical protein